MKIILLLLSGIFLSGCGGPDDSPSQNTEQMYFPENGSQEWETKTVGSLDWNEAAIQPLLDYLDETHTKSFIILVNGRIVMEHYFNGHTATDPWYWASAGKTLTAAMTGIAQQEGFLDMDDKVSDYFGTGWTSAPQAKENMITPRHLLSMASGLDDTRGDDVSPGNLHYTADAGTRWAYHNVYVKLQDIVAHATGQTWNDYFNAKLKSRIGMTGTWIQSGDLSVYWSTSRSMARFGLLMLNNGKWDNEQIINEAYFNEMVTPSQAINKSYGYLWWLNGKESYRLPQTQLQFPGSLIPSAPADMYMALGKNDQKIYIVPSRKIVIIRMGDAATGENFALSGFDAALWEKINDVIGD